MLRLLNVVVVLSALGAATPLVRAEAATGLRVLPPAVSLRSPEAAEQVVVFATGSDGRERDVTREANYQTSSAKVAHVSPTGRIEPRGDGQAELTITVCGLSAKIPVEVADVDSPAPVSFRNDIIPLLTKAGCNAGGCHGKSEGQNGFKLSVFGFDPATDHQAIALDGRGRRLFPAAPERSLLLAKATARIPHGGGQKIDPDSRWNKLLLRWVEEGAALDREAAAPVASIAVEPSEVTLSSSASQQLRVVARLADGRQRGVTVEAEYQSNNDAIAAVDRDGWITATEVPGEAAILVRYLGHVAVCRITRPRPAGEFVRPAEANFIDGLVWDKLAQLRVPPSASGDDATYLRRVFLDTIGTLPTAAEARQFLSDPAPDKRRRLVETLLNRPEYTDYWAQRWSDLLQVDKDIITPQGAVAMTRWIHGQLARNVPYDQFVRSILTVQGSTLGDSPAAFYQVQSDPEKLARSVSQLFLGVRIECAQCHHHPFERWDQPDYYALAGFFTGVTRKQSALGGAKIVGGEGSNLNHPRTMQAIPAAGLGAAPAMFAANADRRPALADWMTAKENPFFARTIANRIWAHYFGRGLVEPLDDLRATNPASNEPLLDALAQHMIEVRYDIKKFTQALLESQVYQLSSATSEGNRLDEQNYSHAPWKPLPAEVLLDAVSQATGVPEAFNGWPMGYRAIQVWDNKLPSHFLEVFGRPTRQTVCACERGTEPSIAQALHLMNATGTVEKIEHRTGRARQLAESELSTDAIIEELYLATVSRFPTDGELKLMRRTFDGVERRTAVEDVLWTLLNTKEFVFNH